MPLKGGPADKSGNSYERRWTVFALIDLLEGLSDSIRIEVPGDEGAGSEFRIAAAGLTEWHQAKRQRDGGPWTIHAMATEGILESFRRRIQAGERCVFISSTGAQELRELVERVDQSASWEEFDRHFLTGEQQKRFQRLQRAFGDPPESEVYESLKRIRVHLIGEPELERWIDDRLGVLVNGSPSTAAAILGQLVDASLHKELRAEDVWWALEEHGIAPRLLRANKSVFRLLTNSVEMFQRKVRRHYIGGERLPREEAEEAFMRLKDNRRIAIVGSAGSGKTVVVETVVEKAQEQGWLVELLSVDRMPEVATTSELGDAMGLPDSPVAVLAGVAGGRKSLLVLDQLDAVSVVSGRHPEQLNVIEDLLTEAESHPQMKVVLACREFDIDNDRKLRTVSVEGATSVIRVGKLSQDAVRSALSNSRLPDELPLPLLDLLQTPLHLSIYVELTTSGVSGVQDARSLTELYEEYWREKRNTCRSNAAPDLWLDVVDRLVDDLTERQELSAPIARFDNFDRQVGLMASEGVLVADELRLSFFHETFFDYSFARRFVARGGSLHQLLATDDQDLFRRSQVRQLLEYERGADFSLYVQDLKWLISSPEVRLHIQALALSLLQTFTDPRQEEWVAIRELVDNPRHPLHGRAWQALRMNPSWLPVLEAVDAWADWFSGRDEETLSRAVWVLSGMTGTYPVEAARLFGTIPDRLRRGRVRDFVRQSEIATHRPLFELLTEAIDAGEYDSDSVRDLWHVLRQLVGRRPVWAVEAIAILLNRSIAISSATSKSNPFERDGVLGRDRGSFSGEVLAKVAKNAAASVVGMLLQPLLEIATSTGRPDTAHGDLLVDSVWGTFRVYGTLTGFKDHLFKAMETALGLLAGQDPSEARDAFRRLKLSKSESGWFLLAKGYSGNPEWFGDEAAEWLATSPEALHLGYSDSPHWASRQLISAITPHCDDEHLLLLEKSVLFYAPAFERTHQGLRGRGYGELCLLNAFQESRRSESVRQRLAELRRKFNVDDVEPPRGIWGGTVPPPIPEDVARKMSNGQWLKAIAKYGEYGTRFANNGRLVGDAGTQSHVLEAVTKDDPLRFANLLLRLPKGSSEAYVSAILRGLAEARLDPQLLLAVCQKAWLMRISHINSWIVRLVQSHAAGTVPEELLDIVSRIAVGDPDPATDAWMEEASDRSANYSWGPDGAGLNSVRGAASLALGQLIREEPLRLPRLKHALRSVSTDPTVQVRAMAAQALTIALYIDSELSLSLFETASDAPDDFLGSHNTQEFLRHAIRLGYFSRVAPLVSRMTKSNDGETRQDGARLIALASFYDQGLDGQVDSALEGDESIRAGIVEVFATNLVIPERRDRSFSIIEKGFADPSKTVRAAASTCFYELEQENLVKYGRLVGAFAMNLRLDDEVGGAFHVLDTNRGTLPSETIALCERFVEQHATEIGDISTAAAGDVGDVMRLVLRMRAQATTPDQRVRCLDVIDVLVSQGVYGVDDELQRIER